MNESPIPPKSTLPFQILQFAIMFVFSLFAFSIGWERLGLAHSDSLGWMLSVTTIIGFEAVLLLAISWYMKYQFQPGEVKWNMKEQEISMDEYKRVYKDYLKGYSHLVSWFDIVDLLFLILIIAVIYLIPFLMSLFLQTIIAAPYVFGIIVILYGLVFSRFSFKLLPGHLSVHSILLSPRKLERYIQIAHSVDGIAFAGLFLVIGESEGYYIISKIQPIARLEGIESAARIDFQIDESLHLKSLTSVLTMSNDTIEVIPISTEKEDLVRAIREIMLMTYNEYISHEGKDPILIDLLKELELEES
jgi:hypothetical protein